MAINRAGGLPAETDFVEICGGDFCKIETSLYGQPRETGIVFDARQPLLGNGKKKLVVADDSGG